MINKINYPISIIISAFILGGAYIYTEGEKSKSIERQAEAKLMTETRQKNLEIEEMRRQEEMENERLAELSQKRIKCASESEVLAVSMFKTQNCLDGNTFWVNECKGGYFNKDQYNNIYENCLKHNGI